MVHMSVPHTASYINDSTKPSVCSRSHVLDCISGPNLGLSGPPEEGTRISSSWRTHTSHSTKGTEVPAEEGGPCSKCIQSYAKTEPLESLGKV